MAVKCENVDMKVHCLVAGVAIASGGIAGGLCLGSVVTGMFAGAMRHLIDLTAWAAGMDRKTSAIAEFAFGFFKGVAIGFILVSSGMSAMVTPLAAFTFVLVSYGLQYLFLEVLDQNKEAVAKYMR